MLIANEFEVPDKCPVNCKFTDDFRNYGQNAICGRCPVFVCSMPDDPTEDDKEIYPLVPPEEYNPDWAYEWVLFFEGKVDSPFLKFVINKG